MSGLTQREAVVELSKKLDEIKRLQQEAYNFAENHGMSYKVVETLEEQVEEWTSSEWYDSSC